MSKINERECRKCCVIFVPNRVTQFYCSDRCRWAYNRRLVESRKLAADPDFYRQHHQNYRDNRNRRWREFYHNLKSDPKKYREYRDRINLAVKKNREKNPEKTLARRKLQLAVRDGLVIRPDSCSICNLPTPVEAHHDDYSKPFEVHWLCKSCHEMEHHKEEQHAQTYTQNPQ